MVISDNVVAVVTALLCVYVDALAAAVVHAVVVMSSHLLLKFFLCSFLLFVAVVGVVVGVGVGGDGGGGANILHFG